MEQPLPQAQPQLEEMRTDRMSQTREIPSTITIGRDTTSQQRGSWLLSKSPELGSPEEISPRGAHTYSSPKSHQPMGALKFPDIDVEE